MVVDPLSDTAATDRLFHALADSTRRDIVATVLRGEQSVSALARRYPMSITAVQKHVAVLEDARLVTKHKRGREQLVVPVPATLAAAHRALDQLEAVWRDRIGRIDALLAAPDLTPNTGGTP